VQPAPGANRWHTIGCVIVLASFLAGVFFSLLQNGMLVSTWVYCGNLQEAFWDDGYPQGASYVDIDIALLRVVIYAVLFALGIALGMRWFSPRQMMIRVLLCGFTGLILVAFGFAVDFSLCSGMLGHSYVPAKCPGGHLPWWPL
jgi:hypothetical protein